VKSVPSVLYVANAVVPSRTANSVHIMKMCEALANNGAKVTLLVPNRFREFEGGARDIFDAYQVRPVFAIKRLPWHRWRYNWVLFTLLSCLYALVRPGMVLYTRFAPCAMFAALTGRRCVFESHALLWERDSPKARLFVWLMKKRRISRLVVISEALKEAYTELWGVDRDQILVAHDAAVDPILDGPKTRLGGREDALKVGYVGHLYPGKGVEVIEAISKELPEFDFHVVGGLERDISHWQARIREPNVHFHGFVPQAKLAGFYRAFDICLLPNRRNVSGYPGESGRTINIGEFTSPLKMFEYMSFAKAIVASDLNVLREVLNEGNSVLVPPDDMPGWREAIRGLAAPEKRGKIGARARADFLSHYTWNARAGAVLLELGLLINDDGSTEGAGYV
jgi:glycosyltransferase involved in cell wall biosynthesis